MLKLKLAKQTQTRCPACGNVVQGEGVVRYGKRFCHSWHAYQYKPPKPLWKRILSPEEDRGGMGGRCC